MNNLYALRKMKYVIPAILFMMLPIGCKGKTVDSQPNIPIISTRVENTPTMKTEIIETQPTNEISVSKPENEEKENQIDDPEQVFNKFNPNLIIHTVKEERDECIPLGKVNAWATQLPYDKISSFLSSDNTNILASSWSPNGEWIAYIESQPSTSAIGEVNPNEDGTDQVWIIRPDGTGKRAVGEGLISVDLLLSSNYCVRFQYIFPDLFWSPDSRYLIFPYITQTMPHVEWVYFLYDLETENLLEYRYLRGNTPIEWSFRGEQLLLVRDDGSIILTEINSGNILERDVIAFPQTDAYYSNEIVWGQYDKSIIALFSIRGKPGAPVYDSIWEFDLSTREWLKKFDYKQLGIKYSENMFTYFGKTKAQILSTLPDSQFYILDFKTWAISGPFLSKTQEYDYIQTKWVMIDNETELLMFISSLIDGQVVGVSNFKNNNMQSRILIDLPWSVYGDITDFSWKKEIE